MRIVIAFLAACAAATAPCAARAQRLDVSGGGTVTVGDPVTLVLRATLPAGATIDALPHPRDSLASSVRLIDVDTLRRPGDGALLYRARVAFYQTGSLTSPAFALAYRMPEREALDSVVSGAVLVTVMATLPDTATAMRDIRPLAALGGAETTRWWLAVIAALLVAAVAAVALRARRRAPPRLAAQIDPERLPPLTAYETARAHLDAIRSSGWADRDVERFYDQAAEVMRHYLKDAYGVRAEQRTTSELLRALPGHLRGQGADAELGALLGEADLVKFARLRPDPRTALVFLARMEALLGQWNSVEAPAPAPSLSPAREEHDALR